MYLKLQCILFPKKKKRKRKGTFFFLQTLEAYTPLEIKKVVIETNEQDTTKALKARNAIYYVSYKCIDDDPSTGWPGDHKAIIRKTMDGKPEHMFLEVTDGTLVEEEE